TLSCAGTEGYVSQGSRWPGAVRTPRAVPDAARRPSTRARWVQSGGHPQDDSAEWTAQGAGTDIGAATTAVCKEVGPPGIPSCLERSRETSSRAPVNEVSRRRSRHGFVAWQVRSLAIRCTLSTRPA